MALAIERQHGLRKDRKFEAEPEAQDDRIIELALGTAAFAALIRRQWERLHQFNLRNLAKKLRVETSAVPSPQFIQDMWLADQKVYLRGALKDHAVSLTTGTLAERRGAFMSHLQLIGTTETYNANALLNEENQKQLGVRRYQWRSSRDERVRDHHRALEGKEFLWIGPDPVGGGAGPSDRGKPGSAPNCRCIAEAVLDDEDGTS